MSYLSKDSMAIILLCSNLGIDLRSPDVVSPYTIHQWNKLAERLVQSPLRRPQAFFETTPEEWRQGLFLKDDEVERLRRLLARAGQVGIEIEQLQSQGIMITTRAEDSYPQRLKDVLKKSSPPLIYYAGEIKNVDNPAIAIVGSRSPDEQAIVFAEQLAKKCAQEGITVISGGAKGIDSVAQEKALLNGGNVISFLSEGLVKKIKYKDVREYIMDGKLLLLSVVHPNAGFSVYSAMDRNKYIYGLSDLTVVVSSNDEKGGTWAGAEENLKNKWVPLYVRQEDGIPKGNEHLLKMGAKSISLEALENESLKDLIEQNNNCSLANHVVMKQTQLMFEDRNLNNNFVDSLPKIDLFQIVWSYMEEILMKPRTIKELLKIFDVHEVQLNDWLNRALREHKIERMSQSDKYVLTTNAVGSTYKTEH